MPFPGTAWSRQTWTNVAMLWRCARMSESVWCGSQLSQGHTEHRTPLGALPTPTLQSQADESGRVRGGSPLRSSKIFQCLKMYWHVYTDTLTLNLVPAAKFLKMSRTQTSAAKTGRFLCDEKSDLFTYLPISLNGSAMFRLCRSHVVKVVIFDTSRHAPQRHWNGLPSRPDPTPCT